MASLSEIIKQRKAVLRQLDQSLRSVDSQVEKSQRKIKALRSRKTKVPEVADMQVLIQYARELEQSLSSYASKINEAVRAFGA